MQSIMDEQRRKGFATIMFPSTSVEMVRKHLNDALHEVGMPPLEKTLPDDDVRMFSLMFHSMVYVLRGAPPEYKTPGFVFAMSHAMVSQLVDRHLGEELTPEKPTLGRRIWDAEDEDADV